MPYTDLTTNTDLTTARVFGPNFGRWLTPDPIGKNAVRLDDPQTWNMYVYARNNPTSLVDPTGELATVSTSCSTGSDNQTTCNVNISASIAVYATPDSGITQEQLDAAAATIQSSIQGAWSGSFTDNGVTYNVSTQVSVQVEGSEQAAMNSGAQNVIGLTNGEPRPGEGAETSRGGFLEAITGRGQDTGVWDINYVGNYAKHEFTQLLGVDNKPGNVLSNTDPMMRPFRATPQDLRWGVSEAVDYTNAVMGLRRSAGMLPYIPTLDSTISVHAPWLIWK
jgi:RHS repeat-associated protein